MDCMFYISIIFGTIFKLNPAPDIGNYKCVFLKYFTKNMNMTYMVGCFNYFDYSNGRSKDKIAIVNEMVQEIS